MTWYTSKALEVGLPSFLPELPVLSYACLVYAILKTQAYAGAGHRRMPVTRRGTASTPEETPKRASAPDEACTSHCQTHPSATHTSFSHPRTSAKRKAATPPLLYQNTMTTFPSTSKTKQQKAVSMDLEKAASSKRHKGNPADMQNCEGSRKENLAETALKTASNGASQPLKHELQDLQVLQSPSRPPLVPRTPATADRTGRIPGIAAAPTSPRLAPAAPQSHLP